MKDYSIRHMFASRGDIRYDLAFSVKKNITVYDIIIPQKDIRYEAAFGVVQDAISQRAVGFGSDFPYNVDFVIGVFALKVLLRNGKHRKEYGEFFREFIEATGNDFPINERETRSVITNISKLGQQIGLLKKNPRKLYRMNGHADRLAGIYQQMRKIYG